jgi:para-nitrobenzyl esterase
MSSTVSTTQGKVRGREHDGVMRFLGIPYAASPTGALRFRAPAPAAAWDGILDAAAFGAVPLDEVLGLSRVPQLRGASRVFS